MLEEKKNKKNPERVFPLGSHPRENGPFVSQCSPPLSQTVGKLPICKYALILHMTLLEPRSAHSHIVQDNMQHWTLWGYHISILCSYRRFFWAFCQSPSTQLPMTKRTPNQTPSKTACELLCSHRILAQLLQITACVSTGESCWDVWCEAFLAFSCNKNKPWFLSNTWKELHVI